MERMSFVCDVPVSIGARLSGIESTLRDSLAGGEGLIATFVNPHASYLARDSNFVARLSRFDYIFCDGVGMAVAAKLATGIETDRISFDATSLSPVVFRICIELNVPIYLVGGKPGVAQHAGELFERIYPGLKVMGTASGYGADPQRAISEILSSSKVVVIAGLGAPKQEEFLLELRARGWGGVGFTCGGYFDQVGEDGDFYPEFINKLNLRFVYRLVKEPRRLWRRYFFEYSDFIRGFLPLAFKYYFYKCFRF